MIVPPSHDVALEGLRRLVTKEWIAAVDQQAADWTMHCLAARLFDPLAARGYEPLPPPHAPAIGACLRTDLGWETLGPGWTVVEQIDVDTAAAEEAIIREIGWLFATTCTIQTPSIERMLDELDQVCPPPLPAEVRSWLRCE